MNTTYYVRVKHHSSLGGWSDWSAVLSFSTIVSFGWVARLGEGPVGGASDSFQGITVDASDNIYAVGYEYTSTSANNSEALITKWNASGNLIWQRKIGGGNTDVFHGVVCDTSGNIYAVGYEYSSSGNTGEALITKWDASGNLTWQKKIGGNSIDYFYGVAIDTSDNIYAVGTEYSSIGTAEAFITRWDTSGNLTWQRKITATTNADSFKGVACDTSGNIYAVGQVFDTGGTPGAYITKWSGSGSLIWQRRLEGGSQTAAYDVVCDASGNIYVAGGFTSPNNFVTKWDSSGNLTWQRTINAAGEFTGIGIDASSNIYVTGKAFNVMTGVGMIVAKLNSSGNLTWQRILESADSDYSKGLACDASGNVYVVGFSNGFPGSYSDEAIISKWPSDITNVVNGQLTGGGLTSLNITNSPASITTSTNTLTSITYSEATTTLTVTTTTLTVATPSLTRSFSTY